MDIYIGGISYNTELDGLEEFFKNNNIVIQNIRIIKDQEGNSRGFGYATVDSQEEADKIFNLEDTSLDGRYLRFDNANNKSTPSSGRGGRGGGG